ncbi:MAG: ACP phosphodiesterase [Cellvibrionaceae bacterium]|nr:ACP phosphodiesterase [Cellvibrionaceae bacterium]
MNYLAHAFLSGDNTEVQLGGLLGDFVKGPIYSQEDRAIKNSIQKPTLLQFDNIRFGIQHHRAIDAYSDSLESFRNCAKLFDKKYWRIAGIIVDICFDHYLAKHWSLHSKTSLAEFSAALYPKMSNCQLAPESFKRFSQRCIEAKLFEIYQDKETIEIALDRVAQRLSRPKLMTGAFDQWMSIYSEMEQLFEHCFREIKNWTGARLASHGYHYQQWQPL